MSEEPFIEESAEPLKKKKEEDKEKPPWLNVYTVLLGISFLALCFAVLALYGELRRYDMEIEPPPIVAPVSTP
jgi:hypothetical protein